jgi:hypothetical protein
MHPRGFVTKRFSAATIMICRSSVAATMFVSAINNAEVAAAWTATVGRPQEQCRNG